MTLTGLASTLGALALVLLAALLAGRLAAFAGLSRRGRASRRLLLQDSLALDARRRLLLLSCDGRPMLLLTSPGRDLFVGWLDDTSPPPSDISAP